MKKNFLFLWMMLITSYLYAQSNDLTIREKDGNQVTISIEDIKKMTFALDQTHALVISKKDSSQIKSILTSIDKITFNKLTHVEESHRAIEKLNKIFVVHQNYPNPFNPNTTIEYELPTPGWIDIKIYNVRGQVIRDLESRYSSTGIHRIEWNGENDYLQPVTNGIYFCKIKFNNSVQMKKLLFVK